MATQVGRKEEIELKDGTVVTLSPLPISTLRKFMANLKKLDEVVIKEDSDQMDIMTVLVDCAAIALSKQLPDITGYLTDKEQSRDEFEDIVDSDIVEKVNEICGGIKFDDPNQRAAAAMAAAAGTR